MRHQWISAGVALLLALACLPAHAGQEPTTRPEVRVGIMLFDGVQIIDFAGPYEVFGTAGFGVTTVSHDGKPVTTAMGLKVTPDVAFDDAPEFDVLLVPGGNVGDAESDPAVLSFVRERAADSRHVLSVCTGAFILASAGLLDGLEATTFTPRIDQLARKYPSVTVVKDVRWADNGRIITSAGLSSGLDAALHVVSRIRGVEQARSVALHLEYDWKPEGGFIRSHMADRYIPMALESAVAWPEDIAMDKVVGVGDERQWLLRFNVTSAVSAEGLLQRIGDGMDGLPEWSRQADAHRWTTEQEGQRVALSLGTMPGASARNYQLELRVQVDPAGDP